MENVADFVLYSAYAVCLLPVVVYILAYKNRLFTFAPLFFYVTVYVLLIVSEGIFFHYFKNTHLIWCLSTLVLGSLMILILKTLSNKNKWLFDLILLAFIVICLVDFYPYEHHWEFNYTSDLILNLVGTFLSVMVIFNLIGQVTHSNANKIEGQFLIAISFFILHASTFFFNLFQDKIYSSFSSLFYVSYIFYLLIIIVHYVLLSFGIWKSAQKKQL
jgi:hypothetical protein